MGENDKPKGILVTGVIGEDVHVVGIRILEYALGEAGFRIIPLGSQVSQEQFIEAALKTKADAILISSLGGHAQSLIPGLRQKCIEASLDNILLYLGGYLAVGETPWVTTEAEFRRLGIDRVYPSGISLDQVIKDLETDIASRRRR